jgi:hypothetical protein
MSYTITTSAGVTLAVISDDTVNNSATSLTLIGKNYSGYGVFLNENYVKLLENFNSSTAPRSPLRGQLWYDSNASVLKLFNGSNWKAIVSSTSSLTSPIDPVIGDQWWDTTVQQLKVWSGSTWITVGPAFSTTSGLSGAVVETIKDNNNADHVVIKLYINDSVIALISRDPTFTPMIALAGFNTIKPGVNLISSTSLAGSQYSGDAENALRLNGITASQFVRSDQAINTPYSITTGGSITVGSSLNIRAVGSATIIRNLVNNNNLDFHANVSGIDTKIISVDAQSSTVNFSNAVDIDGVLSVAGAVEHETTTRLRGVTTLHAALLPNTTIGVPAINIGSSDYKFSGIWAQTFHGANADLAERFEADRVYLPGTVMMLGGVKEITEAKEELTDDVFGVISTAAGFIMNDSAGDNRTHPPIAVNGRVPVRVTGIINKGDRLVCAGNGLARAAGQGELTPFNLIGRALEDKHTKDEGIIEAVVKLNS